MEFDLTDCKNLQNFYVFNSDAIWKLKGDLQQLYSNDDKINLTEVTSVTSWTTREISKNYFDYVLEHAINTAFENIETHGGYYDLTMFSTLISSKTSLKSFSCFKANFPLDNPNCDLSGFQEYTALTTVSLMEICSTQPFSNLTADIDSLTALEINNNSNLTSLSGIEHLKNLTYLDLKNNSIGNISGLSNLKKIKNLFLSNNKISNLSPLLQTIDVTTSKLGYSNLNLRDNSIGIDYDNIQTLLDLYDYGLRTLNLTGNQFYEGQADLVVKKYGEGLSIDYLKEDD